MKLLERAKEVFEIEANAILNLKDKLDDNFEQAVQFIHQCKGRVVICGMGKSGIIGKKISATLASTGTPSFSMHPSEAIHGDLGMLTKHDVFLSISNSGETDEILRLIPSIKPLKIPHITIVGQPSSTLAQHADCTLNVSIEREACPLQLAPMASTTATLAMGDAIAAVLMDVNNFKAESFAMLHPGGALGRRLLTKVSDEMITNSLPVKSPETGIRDLIVSMTEGKLGLVVIEKNEEIVGLITDGDLRRSLNKVADVEFFKLTAKEIMTSSPLTVDVDLSVVKADEMLKLRKITTLLVAQNKKLIGLYRNI